MDLCQVCNQTEQWHLEHKPRHAFVREGEEVRLEERQAPTPPALRMADPVLRLALIKAGVITEQDLSEAEVWVRQASELGMAIAAEQGKYQLLTIEDWVAREAAKVL